MFGQIINCDLKPIKHYALNCSDNRGKLATSSWLSVTDGHRLSLSLTICHCHRFSANSLCIRVIFGHERIVESQCLIWFWSWSEFSIFLLCLFVIREIALQSSNFTDESILLFCASLTLWNKNVVSYKEVSAAQVRFSSVCFSCNI